MKKHKILIVGSMNIDYNIYMETFPKIGETIEADNLKISFGGKGANQAIACKKVGGDVFFYGSIGNDSDGQKYVAYFRNQDIPCEIKETNGSSGSAFIEINKVGDNKISIIHGANYEITKADVDRLLMTIDFDFLVLQHELKPEVTEYLIDNANKKGKMIVLNPAPVSKLSLETLQKISFFILNEKEIEYYLKQNSCKNISDFLIKTKIPYLIKTIGNRGAIFHDKKSCVSFPANGVIPVDTVGAGDCFIGSLVAFLSNGNDIDTAIKYANIAASLSVTRYGTGESYPNLKEIMDKIAIYSNT